MCFCCCFSFLEKKIKGKKDDYEVHHLKDLKTAFHNYVPISVTTFHFPRSIFAPRSDP